MNKRHISKFLSLILRHKPEALGISLDHEGWASTQEIIEKMNQRGMKINLKTIQEVVAEDNKQRYRLTENNHQIRANQGHSIQVDLGLEAIQPPPQLFHGTATRFKDSILEKGIIKGNRQQVHLSADENTAWNVGKRHGKPIILVLNAIRMHEQGSTFYLSKNGVWLVEYVAPEYILEVLE